MAVLFISHSSKDDQLASEIGGWLKSNGFNDIFIDQESIAGGDKWAEELKRSASACRVVIFIVTPNWLASAECFGEFKAAWYMGKRLIPLFLVDPAIQLDAESQQRLSQVYGEDQGLDLLPCLGSDGTLDLNANESLANNFKIGLQAAGANTRVGLDPEAFAIDKALRPTPFPGLASFGDDDADAALFFGRSREIGAVLEDLRSMRALNDHRPLVIQGASGAGKSSLLKAGIIPRLRRETPAWLPLRAFRPGADPLLNFAEALACTYEDFQHGEASGFIRNRLLDAWQKAAKEDNKRLTQQGRERVEAALEAEGCKLREVANRPGASILISVDQAEELTRADDDSGEALAEYLRAALMSEQSPWQLVFTIRTDSFPELQRHRRFQDLEARGYDLRALPVFRFNDVIEDPAKRYGVEIDPVMIDSLMEDAPQTDALPLLAFVMQRLWQQFGKSGKLTADDYKAVGGLTGLIENAAERAWRGIESEQDVPLPAQEPAKRLNDLGAATFVPPLAQINDQGATIRRVSKWHEFSDEQQELLSRFDRWRLVVRKGAEASDGGTVEVAHEALFREWSRLKDWLEPERSRLEALRGLQVAANAWHRHGRKADYLTHFDQRLAEANELAVHERFQNRLGDTEKDYLVASSEAAQRLKNRRRRTQAVFGILALGLVTAGLGWANRPWVEAEYNRAKYALVHYSKVFGKDAAVGLELGQTFQDCTQGSNDCPEMVIIPAGRFMMGERGEQREVTITKRFAVSKFEVTFDQWSACVAYGGCSPAGDRGFGKGRRPVINVSWNDAQRYARWLSRMTGKTYRLLTEAEWEYAARAGTTGDFSFEGGEEKLGEYAWYGANSYSKTHPVGDKKPNAFSLYDMHGNVWEWVNDWYGTYESGSRADPQGPKSGRRRVYRGGGWYDTAGDLRSADRDGHVPDTRSFVLGFRLARTLYVKVGT